MNQTRAIFVILLALAATFIHVSNEGCGLLVLAYCFFPITLVILLIASGSIIASLIHLVRRKKEERCVRVANQIMAGCLIICAAYSGGMYLLVQRQYDIIACHSDIDGLFSYHTYLLFGKDGKVGSCGSSSHKITLPIESAGNYERKGDTLIYTHDLPLIDRDKGQLTCSNKVHDTLLINRGKNQLTSLSRAYHSYDIEQWQSRDE